MQNLLKLLLLCLLAAKPSMCHSQVTEIYPGLAVEETYIDVWGSSAVFPAGTTLEYQDAAATPGYWFNLSIGEPSVHNESGNQVLTGTDWPETWTYTNFYSSITLPLTLNVTDGDTNTYVRLLPHDGDFVIENNDTVILYRNSQHIGIKAVSDEGLIRYASRYVIVDGFTISYTMEDVSLRHLDPDSLKAAMQTETKGYIYGKTGDGLVDGVTGNQNIFSTFDPDNTNYIYNTDFFLKDVDFSGISVYSGIGDASKSALRPFVHTSQFRSCTLINPQYVLASGHYSPIDNWGQIPFTPTVRFVDGYGVVYERTCIDQRRLYGTYDGGVVDADAIIIKLDSPLPSSITPFKLLPIDYDSYAPNLIVPGTGSLSKPDYPLYVCSAERAIRLVRSRTDKGYIDGPTVTAQLALSSNWLFSHHGFLNEDLYSGWASWASIGGDSGTPMFFIHNGEAILIGLHTLPSSAWISMSSYMNDIKDSIIEMGGEYEVEEYDFSVFGYETK